MNRTANRFHSRDDGAWPRELAEVVEPVAVVVRPDGSLDVYGPVAVADQRHGTSDPFTAELYARCSALGEEWNGGDVVDIVTSMLGAAGFSV